MRIRSIKPEFYRSEDVAALTDWGDRMLFIGLWSYVDDNGVGRDNEKLILAALFPLEDDPTEALARIHRGLARIADVGLITRYSVDGKRLLFVTGFGKHQKIDKPTRSPLPRPDDVSPDDPEHSALFTDPSLPPRESSRPLVEDSRGFGEDSTPGYRDLGIEGYRDQGIRDQGRRDNARAAPATPHRGTRISETFTVTDSMRLWADENCPGLDVNRTTMKFVNYWLAKSGSSATKLDWLRTWQNWLLKDFDENPRRPNGRAGPPGDGLTSGERKALAAVEAGRRLQARHDAMNQDPPPERHQLERRQL